MFFYRHLYIVVIVVKITCDTFIHILDNILTIGKIDSVATKTEKNVLYFLGGPVVGHNKALIFTLLSTRDANPPVFTLYFNVTNTPPTTVTCSVNGNTFNITEKDLNRVPEMTTDPIRVGVTVTIRRRDAGEYSCIIRTDISVSPAPFQTIAITSGISISGRLQLLCYDVIIMISSN